MQAIALGDAVIHYADEGPEGAPALVLSNSLGTDFRVWDPLMPHLPEGLRVLRYDKRGHGLSSAPEGPWTIADHAEDLAALMAARGVAEAVVCGLSVGGLIAQVLAVRHPGLVRALVLCDTGARIGTQEMWNARLAAIAEGGIERIADATMERWFTAGFRAEPARIGPWRAMMARTLQSGYVRTAEAIRDCDHREATAGLRLPCLAVCGAEDGATPPALVRETAALIPGSRYEEIADAGHIPCVEQPAVLGGLIAEFLRGL